MVHWGAVTWSVLLGASIRLRVSICSITTANPLAHAPEHINTREGVQFGDIKHFTVLSIWCRISINCLHAYFFINYNIKIISFQYRLVSLVQLQGHRRKKEQRISHYRQELIAEPTFCCRLSAAEPQAGPCSLHASYLNCMFICYYTELKSVLDSSWKRAHV